jgi:tetratricopeptide (TPR) repeat protein
MSDDESSAKTNPADLEAGFTLFRSGRFQEAEARYASVLSKDHDNFQALVSLGHLALLSNRLAEAKDILAEAVERRPDDRSKILLAETFYRLDDFRHSASLFQAVRDDAKAMKLESFEGLVPYQTSGATSTRLSLVQTDPLPFVQISVNGNQRGYLIDTGGAELILDAEFARRAYAAGFTFLKIP